MTFTPCPKPAPREKPAPKGLKRSPMKRSRKPMARRRARLTTDASSAMRARVMSEQDGLCAWGGHEAARLELAHLTPLGMGRSRHDDSHPLNRRANLAGLCVRHHRMLDSMPPDERAEIAERLRAVIECQPGHGSRRSGRAVLGTWDNDERSQR